MFNPTQLTRQIDLISNLNALAQPVAVVGCGAIGSWSALALAKTGFCNIHLFDFDTVSIENVGSQGYGPKEVGQPKVSALGSRIQTLSGISPVQHCEAFTAKTMLPPNTIVLSAVDSLKARKVIYQNCIDNRLQLVDVRMSINQFIVYVMPNVESIQEEIKAITDDSQAVQEPCTNKATSYTALIASGVAVNQIIAINQVWPLQKMIMGNLKELIIVDAYRQ